MTQEAALVSVIIPVHNRFECAQRAVASVIAQSYRPIELIVVDDASAQPFVPRLENCPDDVSVKVLRQGQNLGPGGAREAGRQAARGEFLAYLDSDDYWSPSFLQRLVQALNANPEAGMAYCLARYIEGSRRTGVVKGSDNRYDHVLPTILWGRPWHTSGCVWRRSMTDRIGPWLSLWRWEDYDYDCRAGCLGISLAYVPEPLCFVQSDDPAQVSGRAFQRRGVASFGAALQSMIRHLRQTEWVSDRVARSRLSRMNLNAARQASRLGLLQVALRCLLVGWWFSNSRTRYVFPVACIGVLLLCRQWVISARLLNWMRRQAAPPVAMPELAHRRV